MPDERKRTMERWMERLKSLKELHARSSKRVPAGNAGAAPRSVVRTGPAGEPCRPRPLENEKGIALVLTILLLTLLASLGLWLMVESQTEVKVTQSNERREETVHLAESACWLGLHAVEALALALPSNSTYQNVTPGRNGTYKYLATSQTIKNQNKTSTIFQLSPDIFSSRYFYNTTPPTGWMVNWQGSTSYYTAFFLCRGQGFAKLPAAKGTSVSTLFNFVGRPTR